MAHRAARDLDSEQFKDSIAGLLAAYQDGDRTAAHEFVEALNPMIFRYYLARLGDAAAAEDLTQEFWIRLHQARGSYRRGEPVLPWVFAIARFTRVDGYRKSLRSQGKESPLPEGHEEPSTDPRKRIMDRVAATQILRKLEELPEAQREVFVMMKVSGMSLEQVARATGSSTDAVKQKVYRACESLRRVFGGQKNRDAGGRLR